MESDPCYPFFVPPPFPPFSSDSPSYQDKFLEEDTYQPISDLEVHFNTLFMLESEKGRSKSANNFDAKTDKYSAEHNKWNLNSYENSCKKDIQANASYSKAYPSYSQSCASNKFENKIGNNENGKNESNFLNCSKRTESFASEHSTCSSYMTNDNFHSSTSDYGSMKSSTVECSSDWKFNDFRQKDNESGYETFWTNEKSSLKDDLFFDSNYQSSGKFERNLEKLPLPSLETAFSKQFGKYTERDASIPQNGSTTCNNLDLYLTPDESRALCVDNLDSYCYPNNILNKSEVLKDEYSNKKLQYTELFSKCKLDAKNDAADYGLKCFDSGGCKDGSLDESKDTNSLIEDLDCLGYYPDDDEDMIGFEEYGDESELMSSGSYRERINSEDYKEDDETLENLIGDRVCQWKNCELNFPSQSTLVDHIEKVHVNTYKGDEFSCLWWSCLRGARPFNARYKLLIHMRVHSGHKPNKCSFPACGKAFSRLENLKIHRRSHTGERPYRCQAPRCTKAFSNSSDRAKHQRTHFNARPYACQVEGCIKRYTDPSSLRKHVKNHSCTSTKNSRLIRNTQQTQQQPSQRNPKLETADHKLVACRISNRLIETGKKCDGYKIGKRLHAIREEKETFASKRSKKSNVEVERNFGISSTNCNVSKTLHLDNSNLVNSSDFSVKNINKCDENKRNFKAFDESIVNSFDAKKCNQYEIEDIVYKNASISNVVDHLNYDGSVFDDGKFVLDQKSKIINVESKTSGIEIVESLNFDKVDLVDVNNLGFGDVVEEGNADWRTETDRDVDRLVSVEKPVSGHCNNDFETFMQTQFNIGYYEDSYT